MQDQSTRIRGAAADVVVANGAKREGTQVVLYELGPDVWGKGGKTFARRMAEREAEQASSEG